MNVITIFLETLLPLIFERSASEEGPPLRVLKIGNGSTKSRFRADVKDGIGIVAGELRAIIDLEALKEDLSFSENPISW